MGGGGEGDHVGIDERVGCVGYVEGKKNGWLSW